MVTNNGPSDAPDVVLTDTLPADANFGLALADHGACSQTSGTVTCNVGTINDGEAVTVVVTVSPTAAAAGTTITNAATVSSPLTDPDASNNDASNETEVVSSADLSVSVLPPQNGAITGGLLRYKLTVANEGPSPAEGVTLTAALPTDVAFVSATPAQGSCTESDGTVTCNLGTLSSDASLETTIVATVQVAVEEGATETITGTAAVVGDDNDPITSNNIDQADTVVYEDDDGDGVGDQVEDDAPNGGDGDNNGIPDSEESEVTSLKNAENEQYVTLKSTGGARLIEVEAILNPSPDDAPDEVFPAGFFGFEVRDVPTATTTVELFFPEGTIILGYWKYGPTPGNPEPSWYLFDFDGTTGAVIDLNKVTLNFTDGERGDDDLTANGLIVDEGAPVFGPADLLVNKTDSPDPVLVNEQITYTLIINNDGPSLATDVVVQDTLSQTLPPDVVFVSAAPSQGACVEALLIVDCSLGDIADQGLATIVINITPLEAAGGTTITNSATVSATEDDSDETNNATTQGTVVNRHADTSVTVTAAPEPVLVGEPLTYTLLVTNNGPSQATTVSLTNTLPSNVSFSSVTPSQGSCVHAGGVVTCDLDELDNGATATVVIVVIPAVAAGDTTLTNEAAVTSGVDDFQPDNDTAVENTFVDKSADLSITMTREPDTGDVGSPVAYLLTATSDGPSLATGVVVTDRLPSKMNFVSATPSQGSCDEASGTVTCTLGAIISGANATITIVLRPRDAGSITNTVTIAATEIDPSTANNSAADTLAVRSSDVEAKSGPSPTETVETGADLAVAMTHSPNLVLLGGVLTYVVTVANNGPADATGVTLVDALPEDLVFVSASAGCAHVDGTITCQLGDLVSGNRVTVSILVSPTASGTVVNGVSVAANEADPTPESNTSVHSATVSPAADLRVTVAHSPDKVLLGGQVTYVITVTNDGPTDATVVRVTDTLPEHLAFASATDGCVHTEETVTCPLGDLAAGQSASVVIVADAVTTGTATSITRVDADQADPYGENNSTATTVDVSPAADLAVITARSPDVVLMGDAVTYEITVTNDGPSDATGVTLTDPCRRAWSSCRLLKSALTSRVP